MKKFRFIETESTGRTATVWLNRPAVHNALNAGMIDELTFVMNLFSNNEETDVVILRGRGRSFSSGADLNYMKEQSELSDSDNLADARRLATMFESVYACRKVVIASVHGHSAGGANGLVAASDYAIASTSAIFRFAEARLGLVPATVSPYIVERVGISQAREMLLTGKSYSAEEAHSCRLVNETCRVEFMEEIIERVTTEILKSGPMALRTTKQMLGRLKKMSSDEDIASFTSGLLAEVRSSREAKEGIAAFFEKRKPYWLNINK